MFTIIHNGVEYNVDFENAAELSRLIDESSERKIQLETVYSQSNFAKFINFLNTGEIDIDKDSSYQLECIAVILGCSELHDKLYDFAIEQNDMKLIKNLASMSFNIGYQYYNQNRIAQSDLEKLNHQVKAYKSIIENSQSQKGGRLVRCKRDTNAKHLRIGIFGASNTGKTSLWRLLDPSVIDTPLTPTVSDELRIYTNYNGESYCFIVEDNGGAESLLPFVNSSVKNLNGAIFVYRSEFPDTMKYIENISDKPSKHILIDTSKEGSNFDKENTYNCAFDDNAVAVIEQYLLSLLQD